MNMIRDEFIKPRMITQATKHLRSTYKPVAFYEDMAYWIEDNVFYRANMDEYGAVMPETKQAVDTMTADSIELELLSFIVDKLTEGKEDDTSNSGN
jgi:hypothetical protein